MLVSDHDHTILLRSDAVGWQDQAWVPETKISYPGISANMTDWPDKLHLPSVRRSQFGKTCIFETMFDRDFAPLFLRRCKQEVKLSEDFNGPELQYKSIDNNYSSIVPQ